MTITRRTMLSWLGGASLSLLTGRLMLAQEPALRCPVLMYHRIEVPPDNADAYRINLSVTPDRFEQQLDLLLAAGYQTVTAAQLAAALAGGEPLPDNPIVLSFDDGYTDNYTEAFPRMQGRGMVGTFYVVSDAVSNWGYMNWDQLRQMQAAGNEIGNHSQTHADLSRLDRAALEAEIIGAAQRIEGELGVRPPTFCYPFGRYNQLVARVVAEAGHSAAFTTRFGTAHNHVTRYGLERVRVPNDMTPEGLIWWLAAN